MQPNDNIYQFHATSITGQTIDFTQFTNQVLLIVNTASECGFTPQFAELQQLHQKYHQQGLTIIGFACNQFGGQDPNSNDEILQFCQRNYGVDFLMMAKIDVKGENAHPIYQWLVKQKGGLLTDGIKWNFTKFLLGRDGQVIDRYAPMTKPAQIEQDILLALQSK